METMLCCLLAVGLATLVFAVDRQICLSGLKKDLSEYIENARKVVEIADDPRVIIHYKAVLFSLSTIYHQYFVKEQNG